MTRKERGWFGCLNYRTEWECHAAGFKPIPEAGRHGRQRCVEALNEAAEHLLFANAKDPNHLATYHVFGQVLIKAGRKDEARAILQAGCTKAAGVGGGMGRDLGPAMATLLETL